MCASGFSFSPFLLVAVICWLTCCGVLLGRHLLEIPQVLFIHTKDMIIVCEIVVPDLTGLMLNRHPVLATCLCRSGVNARSNLMILFISFKQQNVKVCSR